MKTIVLVLDHMCTSEGFTVIILPIPNNITAMANDSPAIFDIANDSTGWACSFGWRKRA